MSNWFTNLFKSSAAAQVGAPMLPPAQANQLQAALAILNSLSNSNTPQSTAATAQAPVAQITTTASSAAPSAQVQAVLNTLNPSPATIQQPTTAQIQAAQQALAVAQVNYNNIMAQNKAFEAYNQTLKSALNPTVNPSV